MAYQSIENLKAEDVMTKNVVTATEDEKLSDVLAKLKKYDIHELPVLRKNRLVGLVSYDTLIKRRNLPLSTKVEHFMSTPPKLEKEAPITTVAEMMMSSGYRALPITSKGKILAGIVSRNDMLKGIIQDKKLADTSISSIMTQRPQCIRDNDNITKARTMMKRLSMRTLPVIDKNDKLVGVVGVKDIARIWTPKTKESTGELKGDKISLDVEVKSIMNPEPIFIGKEGRVKDVIKLMQVHDISSVLITEEQKPLGIITPLDLIELLVRTKERESLYVQITGLDEEDAEYYDEMYDLIQKYMSKVNKIEKTRIFALHVVQYHNRSFVKEYELRARLSTKKQMFYAQSDGWDLMRALDEALDALERMVTKEKERRVDARKKLSY
ncbi:MAG: CBS domain-containing protein [Methanomassiliicoccales archaeon]|nr:MAG: CBS domain-containing protein [Methanomassiliicoccales archaeon]